MSKSSLAPLYDLFKLIIAILLLLLFLFLIFRMPSTQPPQALLPTGTPPPPHSTPTVVSAISSPTVTATPPPPTATNTPPAAPTQPPEPTPPTAPTETPAPQGVSTPVAESPSNEIPCQAAARTQLQVGMKAIIQRRLNFRSFAGIHNNRLSTNPPGTQVDVIGGPQCTSYENGSSYLWWQIQLPNGDIGWSAEASAFGGFYFMEPVQ